VLEDTGERIEGWVLALNWSKVRKTPSWPRSWVNFSLFWLYSRRNAWANLDLLGQPNIFLAIERGRAGGAGGPRGDGLPARVLLLGDDADHGRVRARSHCRFRNIATESISKYGMKRMNGSTKRQCDRTLGRVRRHHADHRRREGLVDHDRAGRRHGLRDHGP
jgi:hypothetical protein